MKRSVITFLVLILLSCAASAYFTYPPLTEPPQKIKVPFRTAPYTLIVRVDEKNKDKENRRARLFAVHKKKEIKILKPQDLLAIVPSLRSKKEALSFVRLFTDGETHGLFMQPGALEVFIVDEAHQDMLTDDNYGWGLIGAERAKRLGMKSASIKSAKNGYVIFRNVVFYPQPGKVMRLSCIEERIASKKRYYSREEMRVFSEEPWVERILIKRRP